jgi:hypothetical protein
LGCTGLTLSPLDMAKLGYLYLNHGVWNGEQIVPGEWVDESTSKHIETKGLMNAAEDDGYGYFWWMDAYGGYSAHGYGGQYIFVIPQKNLVAVFTSGLADPDFPTPRKLMEKYVLEAAKSDQALPPSDAAMELGAIIDRIANPVTQPAPLPEIAHRISGKTFQITQGPDFYFNQVTLTFEDGGNVYRSVTIWPEGEYDLLGGLDNRFRVSDITQPQVITVAVKGRWQDEKTFVEILKIFSEIAYVIHTYTFEGNDVTIDGGSSMNSDNLQMKGEMIDP